MRLSNILLYIFLVFFYCSSANAYIGPGMGLGAIISILGILGAILISILAIIYYPIKKLTKKVFNKKKNRVKK